MKKYITILIALLVLSVASKAQTASFSQTATNPTGTVTNTGSDTMSYTSVRSYQLVAIQPVVTKVSGTVGGVSRLYASVNGTNFVATGDTLALSNQTINTTIWKVANPAQSYRIITTGTGSMSATTTAKIAGGQ